MERKAYIDKQQEGTAKPTGKAGKAGPKPWELGPYIYTKPRDDHKLPHSDPRLEFAQQSHGLHQDRGFTPSDDADHKHGPPAFGAMPDLNARASTTSDQGTLAGYNPYGNPYSLVNEFFMSRTSDPQHNSPRELTDRRRSDSQVDYG
jgi:hypothetical protein